MTQVDRRQHHRLLYAGYALLVVVLVLAVLAVNAEIDRAHLHDQAEALDSRIGALTAAHQSAEKLLRAQVRANGVQDQQLDAQSKRLHQQAAAIARLARLRSKDASALTSLHDELAARHTTDARIKQRLQQLEANNAAARNVIDATPAGADKDRP